MEAQAGTRVQAHELAHPGELTRSATLGDWIALTKPNVLSLLLFTTVATMFATGQGYPSLITVLWTFIGGYLAAGGAGAINHYIDRNIDLQMSRTRVRPVPAGRIAPRSALLFGIVLAALSMAVFVFAVNVLAAALALLGLLIYVFVYTLWLKRTTPQNIVIGGAAGAVPPLVGWAAATGHLDPAAFYLFAIVFYWTPPHFWALSLMIKDEYAATGIPMMPVVRGEAETRLQIVLYSLLLVAVTLLPFAGQLYGGVYLVPALALDAAFIGLAALLWRRPSRKAALRLHLYSLVYLALLFLAMVADQAV